MFRLIRDGKRFLAFYLGKRKKYLMVSEAMQRFYAHRKPIRPYAFVRVHNEIKTIDACLKSILPILKGGVLGFNSCTDGTKEYILAFCEKHPQFIPAEYPYDVIPASDHRYQKHVLDPDTRLDSYYNFIWQKLPKNEWIIKIDADHIYHPEYVRQLCRLPLREQDCVILNRINLHCHNDICYLNPHEPFLEVDDHWLIFNGKNMPKFTFKRGWNHEGFYAWETLILPPQSRLIYSILSNWHFPVVKNQRNRFHPEQWIKMQDFDFEKYLKEHKMQGRIPADMLDEQKILHAFNSFNHSGHPMLP